MHRHFSPARLAEKRRRFPIQERPKTNEVVAKTWRIIWSLCPNKPQVIYDHSCTESLEMLTWSTNSMIISNHHSLLDIPVIWSQLLDVLWFEENIFYIMKKSLWKIPGFKAGWWIPISRWAEIRSIKNKQKRKQAIIDARSALKESIDYILSFPMNHIVVFPQGGRKSAVNFTMEKGKLENIYRQNIPYLFVKLAYSNRWKSLHVSMSFSDPSEIASFQDFQSQVNDFYL